jgi:methyl-accepting chemotaxis protein
LNDLLLTLFVGLTGLAVIVQAGILVSIYLLTRRVAGQVELTLGQVRELTPSLKTVTENMKTVSADVVEIGSSAREQFHRIEDMVGETNRTLQDQLQKVDQMSREVPDRVNETVDIVQGALARGVSKGFELLLNRKDRHRTDPAHQDEELFI